MSSDYSENKPENLSEPTEKKRDWQDQLCDMVISEWDKGQQYVSHLNELYDDIYKMLRGERPEKNYDWQSNVVINKVFQVVWTAIPYFIQKIWGADPVIGVKGFDQKGCWQREILLDKWMDKSKYALTMVLILLRGLLNGVAYLKKSWMQRIANGIPFEDRPDDLVINNRDIVVDWNLGPGQSCQKGRFIIHREFVDLQTLYDSKADYFNLDDILHETKQESEGNQDHSQLSQKDHLENPPEPEFYREVEVFERQGLLPVREGKDGELKVVFDLDDIYKENSDVRMEEMIVTVANKKHPTLIRFERNPYKEKQYVDLHIYLDSERWQSMGMVEPFKDIQTALNDNINAMFDEIWKNLMPPTAFNKLALVEWDTIQHAPNQKWMMAGNPNEIIMMPRPTNITTDAWQKHLLFDSEIQLTSSITPPTQGMDKSKTATQGVLNAQFSTGKLDFLVLMIEQTLLIPSAEMTMRFAQMFAHPLTFISMLGEAFRFDEWREQYRYQPVASSVRLPEQKEREIQEDIQIMQIVQGINNPNTPKILNYCLSNILRNRNKPQLATLFDEEFFEPQSDAGQMQMLQRTLGAGTPQNEYGLPMSGQERSVRQATYSPRLLANG